MNTVPQRSRKKASGPRQAFICKWDTETWLVVKVRKVTDRGSTCFDVRWVNISSLNLSDAQAVDGSPDGKFLAFGSSNYTIGLLEANTLTVCPPWLWFYWP